MIDFDRARESVWGTPGFQVRRSTVVSSGLTFLPTQTFVIETIRNNEGWLILLQSVGQEGGQRVVLPNKVVKALYRHYDSIITEARKHRAKQAAITRKTKAMGA